METDIFYKFYFIKCSAKKYMTWNIETSTPLQLLPEAKQ